MPSNDIVDFQLYIIETIVNTFTKDMITNGKAPLSLEQQFSLLMDLRIIKLIRQMSYKLSNDIHILTIDVIMSSFDNESFNALTEEILKNVPRIHPDIDTEYQRQDDNHTFLKMYLKLLNLE